MGGFEAEKERGERRSAPSGEWLLVRSGQRNWAFFFARDCEEVVLAGAGERVDIKLPVDSPLSFYFERMGGELALVRAYGETLCLDGREVLDTARLPPRCLLHVDGVPVHVQKRVAPGGHFRSEVGDLPEEATSGESRTGDDSDSEGGGAVGELLHFDAMVTQVMRADDDEVTLVMPEGDEPQTSGMSADGCTATRAMYVCARTQNERGTLQPRRRIAIDQPPLPLAASPRSRGRQGNVGFGETQILGALPPELVAESEPPRLSEGDPSVEGCDPTPVSPITPPPSARRFQREASDLHMGCAANDFSSEGPPATQELLMRRPSGRGSPCVDRRERVAVEKEEVDRAGIARRVRQRRHVKLLLVALLGAFFFGGLAGGIARLLDAPRSATSGARARKLLHLPSSAERNLRIAERDCMLGRSGREQTITHESARGVRR